MGGMEGRGGEGVRVKGRGGTQGEGRGGKQRGGEWEVRWGRGGDVGKGRAEGRREGSRISCSVFFRRGPPAPVRFPASFGTRHDCLSEDDGGSQARAISLDRGFDQMVCGDVVMHWRGVEGRGGPGGHRN